MHSRTKKILFSLICTILIGIASGDLSGIMNHEVTADKNIASYYDFNVRNTTESLT